jgi:hypothetical protein
MPGYLACGVDCDLGSVISLIHHHKGHWQSKPATLCALRQLRRGGQRYQLLDFLPLYRQQGAADRGEYRQVAGPVAESPNLFD